MYFIKWKKWHPTLHIELFHSYYVLNRKIIDTLKRSVILGVGSDEGGWLQMSSTKNFWIGRIVLYDIVVIDIWLYAFVRSHRTVYRKSLLHANLKNEPKMSRKSKIKCRLSQVNLTMLQINDLATFNWVRQNRNWSK